MALHSQRARSARRSAAPRAQGCRRTRWRRSSRCSAALLLDNQAFDRVADLVTADDFYRDDHRRIWRHIVAG